MDTRWSGAAKYETLLAVAQAANSQRDLSRVLQAVADALEGLVPVDLIAVVTHEGGGIRARALHFRGAARGHLPAGIFQISKCPLRSEAK